MALTARHACVPGLPQILHHPTTRRRDLIFALLAGSLNGEKYRGLRSLHTGQQRAISSMVKQLTKNSGSRTFVGFGDMGRSDRGDFVNCCVRGLLLPSWRGPLPRCAL